MNKGIKHKFEQAARGHGSLFERAQVLSLLGPYYFFARGGQTAAEYMAQGSNDKTKLISREAIAHAFKGGAAGRMLAMGAVFALAEYIELPFSALLALEVGLILYTGIVYGAIGMVNGKDQARANSALRNIDTSPARVEKLSLQLVAPSQPWQTLQMYKGMQAMAQSRSNLAVETAVNRMSPAAS
jgi:hypothetical protein